MTIKKLLKRSGWSLLALFLALNILTAIHAYHFTHFYDDPGIKRVDKGDLSFTQKTNAAFFGIKSSKSVNLSRPTVPYNVIHLKTQEGLDLEGWHLYQSSSIGTVLMFHGHGSCKSKIIDEAMNFYSLGYNVFLLDFRAHGGSEGHVCTIGFKESEDVKLAYEYIKTAGERNIVMWGVSLGAATISKAINDYELNPQQVILEMPFASLLQAVKARVRMMDLPNEPIASLLTFWGGTEQGFWAFNYCPAEYVKQIKCPVLLQWGAQDTRVSRGEIDEIWKNISSPKELVIYETAAHQSLCKKEPEKWKMSVTSFLKSSAKESEK